MKKGRCRHLGIDSRFKLQSMEAGYPSIVISKNGVFLSVNLFNKLNHSQYIQVYLSETTKEIAIIKCERDDEAAVELRVSDKYAKFNNKDFINKVANLCGTTFDKICLRIMGAYIADGDYYVFDLKNPKTGRIRKRNVIESNEGGVNEN